MTKSMNCGRCIVALCWEYPKHVDQVVDCNRRSVAFTDIACFLSY